MTTTPTQPLSDTSIAQDEFRKSWASCMALAMAPEEDQPRHEGEPATIQLISPETKLGKQYKNRISESDKAITINSGDTVFITINSHVYDFMLS